MSTAISGASMLQYEVGLSALAQANQSMKANGAAALMAISAASPETGQALTDMAAGNVASLQAATGSLLNAWG